MKLSPSEMSKYRYGLGANVAYIRKEFLVSYLFNNKDYKFFLLFKAYKYKIIDIFIFL